MVRGLGLNFRLISLIEYVDCFGDVFGVSVRIKKRVKEILNEVIKCGIISGKGLMGFVVVVFYIVVFFEGEKKMQREVVEVVYVIEVIVRNCYKEFVEKFGINVLI